MRDYDRNKPLIVIHVPKAAGSSTRELFKEWFKPGYYQHYENRAHGTLPKQWDLDALHTPEQPVVLHGHFNRFTGYGIDELYPSVEQFVTILRDPYETAVSNYFYVRKNAPRWKVKNNAPKGSLDGFLKSVRPNILNHFPREVTLDNYKDMIEERFIHVGVTEHLEKSLAAIAKKLGKAFDPSGIPVKNVSERDHEASPAAKDAFLEKHRLEYEVYNYALAKLG